MEIIYTEFSCNQIWWRTPPVWKFVILFENKVPCIFMADCIKSWFANTVPVFFISKTAFDLVLQAKYA